MCGFIGRISQIEKGPDDLRRALPFLRRRGPDSQKLWSSADGYVNLFHARLAIIDKDSRADQPFSDKDSRVTVVFAGEIYNYPELKSIFPQYRFRTKSDTEIILAAYLAHGVEGLSLLKGTFSLVIIDEKLKRAILARDPVGKKPLFFTRWAGDVLFGTSLLPLVAASGYGVRIDKDAPEYFWQNGHIDPKTTALEGALPVGPGEILEFDWSGSILNRSFCAPKPSRVYEGEGLEDVVGTVRSLLELAVKKRLHNNPNPAILLSGGIDSTVVSSAAKKVCAQDSLKIPRALTIGSLVPLLNDEFYAVYAARRIGIPLQRVNLTINASRVGELAVKSFGLQDEPLGMISFFLLERLVSAMASYSRILISGDGGDEVFLGYGRPIDWYDKESANSTKENAPNGPTLPLWMSRWAARTVTDALVGHMLAKADRASSEQGVELRCPLLDWDLITYARSVPFEILAHGQRPKALLKDQLQDWPRWFLERPKVGFAYNLRWLWALSRYSGLREGVDRRTIDTFERYLPRALYRNAADWKTTEIFQHFETVWRLLAWSRFLARLDDAKAD